MELKQRRFAFLGGGAMGEALAGGLLAAGVAAEGIAVCDVDEGRRRQLAERLGVHTTASGAEAVRGADVALLAVKPGLAVRLAGELREALGEEEVRQPLWISIAAGISLGQLEAALGRDARIVRAMPNTPALVSAGATALCAGAAASRADAELALALFEAVGIAWEAPQEGLLDAVTGLSGSGPAYVFVFLEALGDAGVRMGLPRDAAYRLAFQTVYGAARLALESGSHPAELKDRVTSPGGTTIAGLERLEAGGLRAALHEAVAAATRRARELGEG